MVWPLEAIQPAGWVDDQVFEPEEITEMDQRILTLAAALRHQGIESWTPHAVLQDASLGHDGSTGVGAYQSGVSGVGRVLCGYKVPGDGNPERRALVAFGRYDNAARASVAYSFGGGSWVIEELSILGTDVTIEYAVCTDDGVLIGSHSQNRSIHRKTNFGSGWTEVSNVAAAGRGLAALHRSPFSGRIIAGEFGGNNTDKILTSDDSGLTWTRRDLGQTWAVQAFADNGVGTIIALCSSGISPKLAISTDDGVTWAPVLNPDLVVGDRNLLNDSLANIAACAVAYVGDVHNAFVVVANTGIYRSRDGVSWQKRSCSAMLGGLSLGPSIPDPAVGNQFLASCGPCLARSVNWNVTMPTLPSQVMRPCVVYSFDLGDTWKLVDLGGPAMNAWKRVTQIKEWNGRFVVGSQGVVYISGLVCAPPPVDFSADG